MPPLPVDPGAVTLAAATDGFGPDDVCAREPIQIPGSIQPHGVLLALGEDSRIVVASDNVATLLGRPAAELVGRPAAEVLGDSQLATALGAVTPNDPDGVGGPLRLRLPAATDRADGAPLGTLAGAEVDVLVHRSTGLQVIELEPVLDALGAGAMSYRTARAALARITAATSVDSLCDVLAGEVHELTGFDRVMVYRFDEHWNGEVVAERCRDDQDPYLGLRYPASDIPAQARALYLRNWTRLIADAVYTPSPLVPSRHPVTDEPIDLSRSALRSVSPIHLDYLANMGVRASMSLSLVIDGELWGLVACHHSAPHRPSFDARSAAEFLAQVASSAIDERESADLREAELRSQQLVVALTDRLGHDDTTLDLALTLRADELLALLGADSLAMRVVLEDAPTVRTFGAPVRDDLAERVADLLHRRAEGAPLATSDGLLALDPRIGAGEFAGAMFLDLGDGRWLLALRHELTRTVDWGGEPTVKVVTAPTTPGALPGYGPRESFDRWREVVRGRSAAWKPWQLTAAEALREFVDRTRIRRAKDQLFVAESLQRALVMPVAPTIPGVELATRYDPSRTGILGGDWWDVVPVGRGRYALVVGDVSGHGPGAAATMAQIRTSLRTYLLDGTPTGEALDRLDRAVAALMRRTIATCAIIEIDPVASEVAVLGAAHLSPVLVPADPSAPVRVLATATRPPLGVQVKAGLAPTVFTIDPGDTLLTFSDGLVERRDLGIDETMRTLTDLVATDRPEVGRLDAWLGRLLDAQVGDGTDDTTVLAARLR